MKAALKTIGLLVLFGILFIASAIIMPVEVQTSGPDPDDGVALIWLLVIDVTAILYLVLRLDLSGAKLLCAVVVVYWGLQTFMTQLETWYFWDAMPAISGSELLKLFVRPLIAVVFFVPIAMVAFGKTGDTSAKLELHFSRKQFVGIISLSLTYAVIYFVFGHYVAWQFEAVRVFYSGTQELEDFFPQLVNTIKRMPWIIPFQVLRGGLWILVGLPVVVCLKGTRAEKITACTLLYAILPAVQLLISNPFLPEAVRMAHFWEVGSSQALFGLLVGIVMTRGSS